MQLSCARHRHDVHQAARRSPEFRVEVSIQDLEFANRTLAEFKRHEEFRFRKIRPRLISIRSVDKSLRIKVIHSGEVGGGARVTIAELSRSGYEDSQIEELAASNRQVFKKSPIQRRARLFAIS